MNRQYRLEYLIKQTFEELNLPKVFAVKGYWEDSTVHIQIYIVAQLNNKQKEDVEVGLAEIMAQFPEGTLSYEYLEISSPLEIVNKKYLAFEANI